MMAVSGSLPRMAACSGWMPVTAPWPSRPGEFHPEPLTEPYVNLSIHTARVTARRLPPSVVCRVPPAAGRPDPNDDDPLPSLHEHYPASSLLRSNPPLTGASILSASPLEPLAPCMGFRLSSGFRTAIRDLFSCFLHRFLCSTRKSHFFAPDPAVLQSRRAQELLRLVRHTNLPRALHLPGNTLTALSTAAHSMRSRDSDQRGSPLSGAQINRATTLYSVGPGPEP